MLEQLPIFLAFLFGFLFFVVELHYRRNLQLHPASLKEFYQWGQKRSTPSPRYSALIFAIVAVYFFQLWESFVRFLFQREPDWPLVGLSVCSLVILLARRILQLRKAKPPLGIGFYWVLAVIFSLGVLLHAWGMLLALPWVAYRGRFLRKSF